VRLTRDKCDGIGAWAAARVTGASFSAIRSFQTAFAFAFTPATAYAAFQTKRSGGD